MLMVCLIGFFYRSYSYSVLLMDLVHREETLYNVIRSVTRNGRSIILTAMFAAILVYLFSIVGYLFFNDQCIVEIEHVTRYTTLVNQTIDNVVYPIYKEMEEIDTVEENHCETLLMSIITTFDQGLRNGGGIGDFLKRVSKDHPQVSLTLNSKNPQKPSKTLINPQKTCNKFLKKTQKKFQTTSKHLKNQLINFSNNIQICCPIRY